MLLSFVPVSLKAQEAADLQGETSARKPKKTTVRQGEASLWQPQSDSRAEDARDSVRWWMLRVGTNLAYDAVTAANISLQAGFCGRFGADVLVSFKPWDLSSSQKYRILLVQPEFRYWFSDGFKGHHLGLEGHLAWYNIAPGKSKIRYQDADGNTPLWGAGIVYGYCFAFTGHLGLDLEIGAGYNRLKYDCFYNTENGACYNTVSRDFWGPTKAAVTLYYRF